jgi:CRISPR system Cascade subunit CasA
MSLRYSLLDEPLIRGRLAAGGRQVDYSLPALLVALAVDAVRDFPALRPHQRHPWHAFLVQLAAMAIHRAGRTQPFDDESAWKEALLALTRAHPDGAAWCLITPHDRPAFLQAPVPTGDVTRWEDDTPTPDSLDILVTSKNHDLKQERIRAAQPDDWLFALVSLQTAAPYPGRGNFGIARMNGGSSSRPGLGIDPPGGPGRRWWRDIRIALAERPKLVEQFGYRDTDGIGLLWLQPWDGKTAYSFSALDPFFIEISRRVRLVADGDRIRALRTTSEGPRIAKAEAKSRKGNTGDLWTPVELAAGKSLGVSATGFDYKRTAELLFGNNYHRPPAQIAGPEDDVEGLTVLARAIAGGQSTSDGYHERRVPVTRTVRKLLIRRQTDQSAAERLATVAGERVQAIDKIRGLLWTALATLFDNGASKERFSDSAKNRANDFVKPFERGEDARFFDELNAEIESDKRGEVRLAWYLSMAERAEGILEDAFEAGPRSGEQRYRARSAALGRLHGGLRSPKVLPTLADHYRKLRAEKETAHEPT